MKVNSPGFTLVEMSIVLAIIGLIVGGVLVGRDLIRASYVRAQITQIGKFNTAVNTFYGKYQALPGDMDNNTAFANGFDTNVHECFNTCSGSGDGNGIVEGNTGRIVSGAAGYFEGQGETVMFWNDLSSPQAGNLIGGKYYGAAIFVPGNDSYYFANNDVLPPNIDVFLPPAAIGGGNFVYAWSGGMLSNDGMNRYGISVVSQIATSSNYGLLSSTPGLTVNQAFSIDAKIDDGFPASGNVEAMYLNQYPTWSYQNPSTAIVPSSASCFDNDGNATASAHYSTNYRGGNAVNCALSFKFQ